MSAHLPPNQPAPQPPPGTRGRSGCATAFLAVLGFFLLLPGLCAAPLVVAFWSSLTAKDLADIVPWLIVFAALFGLGIWLMIRAFRPPAR